MMFDFWRRWRRKRSRAVFRFFDGERTRAVDPFPTYVSLDTHPKFRWDMAEALDEGEPEDTEIACQAAADVFGVKRFKEYENGLTDGELVELLVSFALYVADAKKKYSHMLTSLPATAGESSNVPASKKTGDFSSVSGAASTRPNAGMPSASGAA